MKKFAVLLALVLSAFAIVACGGGDDETTGETTPATTTTEEKAEEGGGNEGGTSGTLAIEADPDGALAFTEDSLTAKAGKLTIDFSNPAPVPHDVRVEDKGGEDVGGTEVITSSDESAPIELKAGEYTFYCSVPGHREAGMEGKLAVE
jgi:plastocyanin